MKYSSVTIALAWTFRVRTFRRLALTAIAASLVVPLLVPNARAQDMSAQDTPAQEAAEAVNLECAAEPLSGSGPGFSSSRDASEDAAVEGWLEKAKAVYPEATWETAKDADIACAVQGLYSKCFAQGTPCRPKAQDAQDGAGSDAGATAAAPAGEAPKAE